MDFNETQELLVVRLQLINFIHRHNSIWLPQLNLSKHNNDHDLVRFTNTELKFDVVLDESHTRLVLSLTSHILYSGLTKLSFLRLKIS